MLRELLGVWRRPKRFDAELQAFERDDARCPPARGAILFVGSSSFRLWQTLSADMAPAIIVNRAFGGSTIADINANFDRVIGSQRPRAIIFYAGDNDLEAGRPPARVIADFERFLKRKTHRLGQTPVYFVSIKPSPARLGLKSAQDGVNRAVQALAQHRPDLLYLDVATPMLAAERLADLFLGDGIHLSASGYAVWRPVIRAAIEAGGTV